MTQLGSYSVLPVIPKVLDVSGLHACQIVLSERALLLLNNIQSPFHETAFYSTDYSSGNRTFSQQPSDWFVDIFIRNFVTSEKRMLPYLWRTL